MEVHVVSTGYASPNAAQCRRSVKAQEGVRAIHHYVEASEQRPTKTKLENLWHAIAALAPTDVVALVDGDDFLSHRRALLVVAELHAGGAWVTHGSFMTPDGKPGFAAPYAQDEDYRATPWRLTHLKSFRAGLFQRIRLEDLAFGDANAWIDRGADDQAFMFPIVEMAGRARVVFVPDILYIYDFARSFEMTASPAQLAHLRATSHHVRTLPRYERIEAL